ncbi:exodeoxyribonuclease V subunit gamma [Candidatus Providencia siddallii]|uniref:RecBCD enzyme subunit RecC n=1 Tax=Candidatus Providencia siddallii TaxID=1715285 RepID=A0ABM9NNH1_9GAMM
MFKIYHSNQLFSLKNLIIDIIKNKQFSNPFEEEIIIVENFEISQWLQIELTKYFGITCNIHYKLPRDFILEMIYKILPDISKNNHYTKNLIKWRIITILPKIINNKKLKELKFYIKNDIDGRKLHQLSEKIANLFESYMIYRPKLITQWEKNKLININNKNQSWQKKLWRELFVYRKTLEKKTQHLLTIHKIFIKFLSAPNYLKNFFPKRIFIYGISSLPPIYIQILNIISKYTDIYLMFKNPCKHFLKYNKYLLCLDITKQQKKPININKKEKKINPLLVSWGKLGNDFLKLITNIKNSKKFFIFTDTNRLTLLENIKQDILDSKNNIQLGKTIEKYKTSKNKRLINLLDNTITFNSCYNIKKEIENLYEKLLEFFEKDNTLTPKDILVKVSNIEVYTPYIYAIFSKDKSENYIPFSILNKKPLKSNPIIQAFISLLNLPKVRFFKDQIFDLLDISAISKKFDINENELDILNNWINKYEIKFGLDNNNFKDLNLPIINQNTWEFGLKKILSKYSINKDFKSLDNIFSYDKYNNTKLKLINKLFFFIETLKKWRILLKKKYSLKKWKNIYKELINDFFIINDNTEIILTLLKNQLYKIINTATTSGHTKHIKSLLIRDELLISINEKKENYNFFTGSVTFCTFTQMKSIPFKIICLLGMNDNVFPRNITQENFDLKKNKIILGDKKTDYEDKYLFLETLISTTKIFYLSYIGISINNEPRNPSILIEELLNYICQNFRIIGTENLNVDDSYKILKKHLITKHNNIQFKKENFFNKTKNQNYINKSLKKTIITKSKNKQNSFLIKKNKIITKINIEELLNFYNNPIKFFFQKKLNVYFSEEKESFDSEPFYFNKLQLHNLYKKILDFSIKNKNIKSIYDKLKIEGKLPINNFDKILWKESIKNTSHLIKKIKEHNEKPFDYYIKCKIKNININGSLKNIYKTGILRYQPNYINANNFIRLWIEHLFFNFKISEKETTILDINNNYYKFPSIEKKKNLNYLELLIMGYLKGQNSPLLLLNNSCWNWLSACFNKITNQYDFSSPNVLQKAESILVQNLQGNKIKYGEIKDLYLSRIHKNINDILIQSLIKNTKKYLLPIKKHIIKITF